MITAVVLLGVKCLVFHGNVALIGANFQFHSATSVVLIKVCKFTVREKELNQLV